MQALGLLELSVQAQTIQQQLGKTFNKIFNKFLSFAICELKLNLGFLFIYHLSSSFLIKLYYIITAFSKMKTQVFCFIVWRAARLQRFD